MPVREAPYSAKIIRAFIEGLVPEGHGVREGLGRECGTAFVHHLAVGGGNVEHLPHQVAVGALTDLDRTIGAPLRRHHPRRTRRPGLRTSSPHPLVKPARNPPRKPTSPHQLRWACPRPHLYW